MIKITLEINEEVYSAKCDDAEKVKLFIDCCLELEEKMKLVKEELKHWQIKKEVNNSSPFSLFS